MQKLPLYIGNEALKGKVSLKFSKPGQRIEHTGIKVELLGQIGWLLFFYLLISFDWVFYFEEMFYDRGQQHEFTSLVTEISGPGVISEDQVD